ncbi:MAG TPA: hypothetical protein VKZ79_08695 [Alphaproteobacteria bacterium]|nr:hypothetical protein [Alphaproteobacteria bacterium]
MPDIGEQARPVERVGTIREVVGVFNDQEHMQLAVDDLQAHGFNRANLTTAADSRTMQRQTGHGYIDVRDIEDDGDVPRAIYVSKRSLGNAEGVLIGIAIYVPTCIAAAILAARGATDITLIIGVLIVAAVGGLLGFMFARRLDGAYTQRIREQLEHGGIVLWVSVYSDVQEKLAMEILQTAAGRDVHAHDRPVTAKPMPGWIGPSYNLSFMRLLGM